MNPHCIKFCSPRYSTSFSQSVCTSTHARTLYSPAMSEIDCSIIAGIVVVVIYLYNISVHTLAIFDADMRSRTSPFSVTGIDPMSTDWLFTILISTKKNPGRISVSWIFRLPYTYKFYLISSVNFVQYLFRQHVTLSKHLT